MTERTRMKNTDTSLSRARSQNKVPELDKKMITHWLRAVEKSDSQFGRINATEWVKKERDRINKNGGCCSAYSFDSPRGPLVCLAWGSEIIEKLELI